MGPPLTSVTELQSTNKVAQSIALEETDNILEDRFDSLENQGNTDQFPISDVVLTIDRGIYSPDALAESTEELEMLPNLVDVDNHTTVQGGGHLTD